jgi:hypothetical protein
MTGLPGFNYERFREVARELEAQGVVPVNPGELADASQVVHHNPFSDDIEWWQKCLERDINIIASPEVEAVIVLPGWQKSNGALLELTVASGLLKPIFTYPDWEPVVFPVPTADKRGLVKAANAAKATSCLPKHLLR